MKPTELYQREPEKVIKPFDVARDHFDYGDYFIGCYYNHLPELTFDRYEACHVDASDKVEIKVYKDFRFDSRRFWRLCSVWFDGEPVMIIQNAGREGDDHARRIITDRHRYMQMVDHINSLVRIKVFYDELNRDIIEPDSDVPDLIKFYGNTLDGYFEMY